MTVTVKVDAVTCVAAVGTCVFQRVRRRRAIGSASVRRALAVVVVRVVGAAARGRRPRSRRAEAVGLAPVLVEGEVGDVESSVRARRCALMLCAGAGGNTLPPGDRRVHSREVVVGVVLHIAQVVPPAPAELGQLGHVLPA